MTEDYRTRLTGHRYLFCGRDKSRPYNYLVNTY